MEKLTGCTVSKGQAGVVVSHSCDLAHHIAENEPYVELLVGEPIQALDGNFTHGKHPRKLHLPIHLSGRENQAVEFVPWRRHIVERQSLLENEPDRERYLLREEITVLAAWMAVSVKVVV
ncbi:MAG TPA: hypothetical protein DCY12_01950, partial [Candidatus Atribacteria bacterium]|nr:hypothetical protein [Candidatus Atribacteria bacterium]